MLMPVNQAPYPASRFRRTRASASLRNLVRDGAGHDLADLRARRRGRGGARGLHARCCAPLGRPDRGGREAEAHDLGIPAICLFPYTDVSLKTELCEEAWNPDNLSNRAIRAIKAAVPEIAVMTDIALDPYNANGHDGIVRDGEIVNDETVEALVKMALAQAEAGPTSSGRRT
jgi:porphobilinogen synthase